MNTELLKVAIRYQAIYFQDYPLREEKKISPISASFVSKLNQLGYTVDESLLHHLNMCTAKELLTIYSVFSEVLQLDQNWNPLVKRWDEPTEETTFDHFATLLSNVFRLSNGQTLSCGHIIPDGTFPLVRYNGCPFCGIPFKLNDKIHLGQGSKLKVLTLWNADNANVALNNLVNSQSALDATQVGTLKVLLNYFSTTAVPSMKETLVIMVDHLTSTGKGLDAGRLFRTPVDILRYLWYKHTGYTQLIEPKIILKRLEKNQRCFSVYRDLSCSAGVINKKSLKLKYSRAESKLYASWLNNLPMAVEQMAASMHPKRGMWVRFIRALRLGEYSRSKEMPRLKELLDVFYNELYVTTDSLIQHYRLKYDAEKTFALLTSRPGLFARSLFANMLWFGAEDTLRAFREVVDKVPAKLLITLNSYAKVYFVSNQSRIIKPLGGTAKRVAANKYLNLYTEDDLNAMVQAVENVCLESLGNRFAKMKNTNRTVYIDPSLFFIPIPVGDRAESVQDLPVALMGTHFPIEGDKVRLFMQWGKGLKAQHLDMDLSCQIAYEQKIVNCGYFNLVVDGAKHSGDIRSIPNQVGTAEYIEIDINELVQRDARYVSFTCNAFSNGEIVPNLTVGWMNSRFPMKIHAYTGVAYDPSCVQHQIRITQSLSKGLVFGVLDVRNKCIIWLEQSFGGQTVMNLDVQNVAALIRRLQSKMTIGNILKLRAEAQDLEIVDCLEKADEVYPREWALDIAAVTTLLLG